jgi:hypothetical protein
MDQMCLGILPADSAGPRIAWNSLDALDFERIAADGERVP